MLSLEPLPVTSQEQIAFLAKLLNIIGGLQDLVDDFCQLLTAEQDGCILGNESENWDVSF